MSFGAFVLTFYQTDELNIARIRLQPETLAAVIATVTNAPPAGPVTSGFPSAIARKGKRELGIGARYITVRITDADPSPYADVNQTIVIPTLSVFDGIVAGQVGTYNGKAIEVLRKFREEIT